MNNIVKVSALAAALWAAPLHAQTLRGTPNEVRELAASAIRAEDPRTAAIASDALLAQIPDDPLTLLIRSEAALQLQDFDGAVSFGQRAFWNSASDAQRFRATRLIALAHAQLEQDGRAQLWLRAARQYAPNETASANVARDYQALRRRNPLSVSLRFGVTPSSNINSGAADENIELFDLPFVLSEDALALSGWEISGGASIRYRARTDATSATFFDFGLSGATYRLTNSAQERIEEDGSDVTGSDFSNATINFGVSHRFLISPDAGLTNVSLSFAQTYREGEANRRYFTASADHTWTVSDTDRFTLSGFSQRQERNQNGDKAAVLDISATYSKAFENIGSFSLGASVRDNAAEDPNEDYDAVRYRLTFSPQEPLAGINLGFTLSYEERDFGKEATFAGVRTDTLTSFGVRAVFSQIEYFGFQPVLSAERTQQVSDVNLFDRDYTELGIDIVSSF